jgi:hypothetical protein
MFSLTIDGQINLDLNLFTKIHRLILINPTDRVLALVDSHILPQLEHLSINNVGPASIVSHLQKTIFSNGFSNLQSYYMHGHRIVPVIEDWRQSPALRVLKVSYVESFVFTAILAACPNLYFLDLGIVNPSKPSTGVKPHRNLKHFILRTSYNTWSNNEYEGFLTDMFAYLPNVEKLSTHRRDKVSIINNSFIKYNWLSSILASYFPLLRRYYCYFHVFHIGHIKIKIGPHLMNIVNQLKDNFQNVHRNRYQSRLIID